MTDTPEDRAAALEDSIPEEEPAGADLAVVDDPTPDPAELGRAGRIADIAVAASFVLKVGWVLVVSRGWFYTADDWDFLTRDSFGQIFDPHHGHLTALVSAYAMAIRPLFGYDYWPEYAILPAVSIPLIGVAAYLVWRRHRLTPVVAASAAIFLMWIGTAAWVQYGHSGMGFAFAATILAIEVDQQRPSTRTVSAGLALTLIAVFASTIGAIGAIGRLMAALLRRKWTGVASTVPVLVGFLWYRSIHGSPGDLILAPGDIGTGLGVAFQLIGDGMLVVVPWSSELAWVLGLAMIAIALGALAVSRMSYATTAIVAMGGGYILSVVLYRYLGRPDKLTALQENGLNLVKVTSPRYTQIFLTIVIVAVVPLIAKWFTNKRAAFALIGVVAVLVGIGAYHSAVRYDLIEDKSRSIASRVSGYLTLLGEGEPTVLDGRQIDPRVGKALTFETLNWMVDEGLDTSMLASDVFHAADVQPIPAELARGRMRLNLWEKGKIAGTWSDLGAKSQKTCRDFENRKSFEVGAPVLYRLELTNPDIAIILKWEDEYGEGTVLIGEAETTWRDGRAVLFVKTAAPSPGEPPPVMRIQAGNERRKINVTMCLQKSPKKNASPSG